MRVLSFATYVSLLWGAALLAGCPPEDEGPPVATDVDADSAIAADGAAPPLPEDAGALPDGSTTGVGPTWHQEIAPLLNKKCGGCHQQGGIAPFSVQNYASARPFAAPMADAVESGRMPPFLARETADCKPKLPWAHDPRLTDSEKKLLRAWAERGAPEGTLSEPLVAPRVQALPREDLAVQLPTPIQVDGANDIHTCLVLDPKLDADRYVIGTQVVAGNTKVLHHAVSYLVLPGKTSGLLGLGGATRTKAELIAAVKAERGVALGERYDCKAGLGLNTLPIETLDVWAPGGAPRKLPDDTGIFIPKDALVLLNLHYHPTGGGAETDATTKLALQFADKKPPKVAQVVQLGNIPVDVPFAPQRLVPQPGEWFAEFKIPKNEPKHVEEMTVSLSLPAPVRVYSMFTHMHYVGRDMRVTVERQGASECLIQTPDWDFNWQLVYDYQGSFEQLPELRSGDVLRLHCEFDNSMNNPALRAELARRNLNEPIDVKLGEDTHDEMCITFMGLTYPNPL